MPSRRDIPTPAYVAALHGAGFRNAIGPELPLASAHVLENPNAPGRRFLRQEGCPLRVALAKLLGELPSARRAGSRRSRRA